MTLSEAQTSRHPAGDVRSSTADSGLPLLPQDTFSTCRAHYPGGLSRCFSVGSTRLPARASSRDTLAFPDLISGRHPRFNFSRLARASLALRPVDSLTHLTWAWSEGFDTARYQTASLLSYTGIPKPPVVGLSPTGCLVRSARTLGSFGTGRFGRKSSPGAGSAPVRWRTHIGRFG